MAMRCVCAAAASCCGCEEVAEEDDDGVTSSPPPLAELLRMDELPCMRRSNKARSEWPSSSSVSSSKEDETSDPPALWDDR